MTSRAIPHILRQLGTVFGNLFGRYKVRSPTVAGKPVDPTPYLRVSKCEREVGPPSLSSLPSSQ
jgi:hypothetical protein